MLIVATLIATSGCIQRRITVTSEPVGALVHLNDEEVGRTPITVPFTYYGVYDVRLSLEGHHPIWTTRKTDMPWWELPGPDIVAEAVSDKTVEFTWHFQLDRVSMIDEPMLIDRARQMRAMVRQELPDDPEPVTEAPEVDELKVSDPEVSDPGGNDPGVETTDPPAAEHDAEP